MKIDHIAFWVSDLERMKRFYSKYFEGQSGNLYQNPVKNFSSYFISFDQGCRIELMHKPEIPLIRNGAGEEYRGLIHFALSVGTKERVDSITEQLRADGFAIAGEPRTTGDGYYESVILDPENNRIEITV